MPRARKRPVEVLTVAECRALVRAAAGRGVTAARNMAVVVVLWRAGLRAAELLALRPKDFDFDAGTIRILRGKGSKARTVALDATACAVVSIWLTRRRELGIGGSSPLFCTMRGNRMWHSYLRQLLPRLAQRAGIRKRVHPHGMRHTFAAHLAAEGVPMPVIMAALGHENVATTSTYVAHVAAPEVVSTLRARSWEGAAEPPPPVELPPSDLPPEPERTKRKKRPPPGPKRTEAGPARRGRQASQPARRTRAGRGRQRSGGR